MTEEDLRTKIIYTWLKDLGFEDKQLHFEYSFKINLGKYTYKVESSSEIPQEIASPRSDILVKDNNNKNLLIIEVKAPNHKLNDSDKLQAISYSRLLPQIAPFTILTNGLETRIYDSITSELIEGNYIPSNHPYINNGFKVSVPNYSFYNDTLETFIGLSKENLLAFCKQQVEESMSLLKSDDIYSGKKYIPSLYLKRKTQEKKLEKLIFKEDSKLIFVTGSAQHGKTSFICNFVETLLNDGFPCIFYPAINIHNSLLDELESDFRWILSENLSIYNMLTKKLQNILIETNSKLFIFLDGLNETSLEFISKLNKDFSRLKNLNITFILSFTNITARRLFSDTVNNVTELANHLSLSIRDLEALEIDSKQHNENIINIPPYTNQEAIDAFEKYSTIYNVSAKIHKVFHDPFLLRIIMNYYNNKTYNGNVDEIKFLEYYIKEKALRTKNLDELTIEYILKNIAQDVFKYDAPLPLKNVLKFMKNEQIEPLFESALLSKTYKNNQKFLEFYNEREQCFYISIIAQEWHKKMASYDFFQSELENILNTNSGKLALNWYLKINPFIIKNYWEKLFSNKLYEVQSIVLKSFALFLNNFDENAEEWFINFLEKALSSEEKKIRVESFKLIKYFPELKTQIFSDDNDNKQLCLDEILFTGEDEELDYDPFDIISYDTIKEMHDDEYVSYYDDSSITIKLKSIILEKQNINALEILAYCSPFICIDFLIDKYVNLKHIVNKENMIAYYLDNELMEFYYGSMCPGYLDGVEQEELIEFYKEQIIIYEKISKRYKNTKLLNFFKQQVESFFMMLDENSVSQLQCKNSKEVIDVVHPNQSYMEFD